MTAPAIARPRPRWESALKWFAMSGKLLKLIKVLKFAKFTKVLVTFVSMALFAVTYSFMFGWWFSVGFAVCLLIHELGHVAELKRLGYKTGAPVFIPFLGAVIFAPGNMKSGEDEAYIGIGGPVYGMLAALFCHVMWLTGGGTFWLALGYLAAFLNLFNLIPIRPLDGGRIMQAVGPWFRWVGLAVMVAFTLITKNPGLCILWIMVMDDLNVPLRAKVILGVGIQLVMMTLMTLGMSPQPPVVDWVDIALATLFNLTNLWLYSRWLRGDTQLYTPTQYPKLPTRRRLIWFVTYVALAGSIWLLMLEQSRVLEVLKAVR